MVDTFAKQSLLPTAETQTQVVGCFRAKYPLFSYRIPRNQEPIFGGTRPNAPFGGFQHVFFKRKTPTWENLRIYNSLIIGEEKSTPHDLHHTGTYPTTGYY